MPNDKPQDDRTTPADACAPTPRAVTGRIDSVDALRGFDMMWIAGGDQVFRRLQDACPDNAVLAFLGTQCEHVGWAGFRFYDMIFPLFVFIAGLSIVLSLDRLIERVGRRAAHGRLLKRGLLLYVLGVLYNGGLSKPWPHVRLLGVLPRIAICYTITALLYCNLKKRGLLVSLITVLVGYWAIMTFIPAPGEHVVSFEPDHNIANWIDFNYLPGRMHDHSWDPEGLLSTIPAVGTCLLGVFAGMLLTEPRLCMKRKVALMFVAGLALVVLGCAWGLEFPIIKKLWTSSYVLVAGGCSAMLLALFALLIDVLGWKRWSVPFKWIGANAVTIYLVGSVCDFDDLALRFVGGSVGLAAGKFAEPLAMATSLLFVFLFARFLYQRKIFIRL